jgi:acyl-CoA dehydrogenase
MAKYWLAGCECRTIDKCVQIHGGFGYMIEHPVAGMWVESRVERIDTGANKIMMKEVTGSSL